MAFFRNGSHFVLFPNAILSIFGVRSGAQLNSLTILPKGLSMLAAYFLSNALISSYGYEFYNIFFYISCGLSSISLMIMLFFFDETPIMRPESSSPYDWSSLRKRNNVFIIISFQPMLESYKTNTKPFKPLLPVGASNIELTKAYRMSHSIFDSIQSLQFIHR